MTDEQLYQLIIEKKNIISSSYRMVDAYTGLTEDQVLRIYQWIDEEEVKLDQLIALYEERTGINLSLQDENALQ